MKINHKDLITALECIKPALSGKSTITGLDHIWFNQNHVYAYNGVICIDLPLSTDFEGGILGDVLIKFISTCQTIDLDILKTDSSITIRSGKSRIVLNDVLPLERSARDFPSFDARETGINIPEIFCSSLKNNLISVSTNSALAAYAGVFMIEDTNGKLNLFSTDSKSISWERIPSFINLNDTKLLLPSEFCAQLLKLYEEEENYILLNDGYATFENGDHVILLSRLLDPDTSPNYLAAIRKHIRKAESYCKIPDSLKGALERCELVQQERSDDPILLSIKDTCIDVTIETAIGSIHEQIELEMPHSEVIVAANSTSILRALDSYKEFTVTDGAIILRNNEDSYHLIATTEA